MLMPPSVKKSKSLTHEIPCAVALTVASNSSGLALLWLNRNPPTPLCWIMSASVMGLKENESWWPRIWNWTPLAKKSWTRLQRWVEITVCATYIIGLTLCHTYYFLLHSLHLSITLPKKASCVIQGGSCLHRESEYIYLSKMKEIEIWILVRKAAVISQSTVANLVRHVFIGTVVVIELYCVHACRKTLSWAKIRIS
jgi:hypothetical protein